MKKERKKYCARINDSINKFPDSLTKIKEHLSNHVNINADFDNVYKSLINVLAENFKDENDFYEVLDNVLLSEKYCENIHLRRTLNLNNEFDFIDDVLTIDHQANGALAAKTYSFWYFRDYTLDLFSDFIAFLSEENEFKGASLYEKTHFEFIKGKALSESDLNDIESSISESEFLQYKPYIKTLKCILMNIDIIDCYLSKTDEQKLHEVDIKSHILKEIQPELVISAQELHEARTESASNTSELIIKKRELLADKLGVKPNEARGVRNSTLENLLYVYAFVDIKENLNKNILKLSKMGLIDSEELMADFEVDGDVTMYPIVKLESLISIEIILDCLAFHFSEGGCYE